MDIKLVETIILTAINAFSSFLIIIVLANSDRLKLYRWFAAMTFCLLVWVNTAYIGYYTNDTDIATLFYRVNLVFVIAFFFSAYIFYIENFLGINNKYLRVFVIACTVFLSILSLFTNTINNGVINQDWGNEVKFGSLNMLFYLYSGLLSIIFIYFFVAKYLASSFLEKRQLIYFILGAVLFIVLNVVFNVISPVLLNSARYQHLGDYSAILFLLFTTFAIIKRDFLNIKTALPAFLISVVSTLLLIDIIAFNNSALERFAKIVIFILITLISILLVRSVLNEIKQREEVARVNKQLRETNVALDGALSELQESRRKERDMMDVMGHELRTPLTVVRNALSVLQTEINKAGAVSKERLDKYLNMALESARREVTLVETLLSATKVDASRLQLDMIKVPVSEVIQHAIESQKDIIEEKELKVRNSDLTKELYMFTDRVRVQEIMDNFLSNAAKYTPSQGSIEINVWRAKQKVWIQVKDTGFGISPEDIVNLGKKFFRAQHHIDGEGMVRPGGTGLGLYVTFELIRIMGGELYIQSTVGKGTAFTFGLSEFENQKEHQFDQTFDAGNMDNRQHVFLNEEPPAA